LNGRKTNKISAVGLVHRLISCVELFIIHDENSVIRKPNSHLVLWFPAQKPSWNSVSKGPNSEGSFYFFFMCIVGAYEGLVGDRNLVSENRVGTGGFLTCDFVFSIFYDSSGSGGETPVADACFKHERYFILFQCFLIGRFEG